MFDETDVLCRGDIYKTGFDFEKNSNCTLDKNLS
jgi:hypothetical protein